MRFVNTLIYRVVKVDCVTGERRYTGSCVTVAGRKFCRRTDAEVDDGLMSATTDHITGHTIRFVAERVDQKALVGLAETLRNAAKLLEGIKKNAEKS